ncbi:MAG TPA: polyribonucleotide nucleotidyltransferase [Nitrospirales bacterium]|nr:polyribonucleotide nucleotidyltransferase [Nitrospirales bacterium]
MKQRVELEVAGRPLILESGWIAKQAHGSVWARYGDTVVLAVATAAKSPKPGLDFFPLTVEYQEKSYAAGKFPGGFFKREGRPSEKATLTSRLIDRPLRPLFPKAFNCETQVIATVLSVDESGASDVLAMTAASAAVTISDIPFGGPIAGIRIGRVNDAFVVNPDLAALEESTLNLIVAGTADAVMMVEAGSAGLPEDTMLEAIALAHEEIKKIVSGILELQSLVGRPKRVVVEETIDSALQSSVEGAALEPMRKALTTANKADRELELHTLTQEIVEQFGHSESDPDPARQKQIKNIFHDMESREVRLKVLDKGIRIDGRGVTDIRPITCETGVLPRTHGSAIFTRGETQALAVITLGTKLDQQRMDALEGEGYRTFLLHYNFPPYSVGEVKPLRSPGRREIGHGALAERALIPVIPSQEEFPYTIRLVSEIFESNGSSSMATVCGGSMAMMETGVPIKEHVAGIAMGLIKEGQRIAILSDIVGAEDHLGDMDFKVCGTASVITALQMDIKVGGVSMDEMRQALEQAKTGRLTILEKMREAISQPNANLSIYAPRIFTLKIKPDKISSVIGPGGKVIRNIVAETNVKIDVDNSGLITIASVDEASAEKALAMVNALTEEVEIGKLYFGKVKKIMEFGAFVEILPNVDGLVHISQLAPHRVNTVADEVAEGDQFMVKVLDIDKQGKIRLSRKEAMTPEEVAKAAEANA